MISGACHPGGSLYRPAMSRVTAVLLAWALALGVGWAALGGYAAVASSVSNWLGLSHNQVIWVDQPSPLPEGSRP